MISALWEVANGDGNVADHSTPSPAVSSSQVTIFPPPYSDAYPNNQAAVVTSPTHWVSVKVALIRSIRRGVFFDRKYWARHSRTGDVLKPIYFSSAIIEEKAHQLNKSASGCGW